MASPILINAVAKQLLKPGMVDSAERFFNAELDKAMESKDRTATRELTEVIAAIEEHKAKAQAKPIPATAQAQPQPDPKASAKTK